MQTFIPRQYTMEIFEEKVKTIFHYIHEYGVSNVKLDYLHLEKLTEDELRIFKKFVHKGFRLGQDIILTELLDIENELKKQTLRKKTHNKNRDKELILNTNKEIRILKYKNAILRNFADFIAWQVFQNQYYIARRFWSGSRNRPSLNNSNIESVIELVKQLHEKDDECFALINDLTNIIDIGDILLIKANTIEHIEVKSGSINKEILNLIHNFSPEEANKKLAGLPNPKEFLKHFDRTLSQMEKGIKALELIDKEEGSDPFTSLNVKISETTATMIPYYNEMFEMLKELETKNYSFRVIENIISIGMYKNDFLDKGEILMKCISKEQTGKDYPLFSYLQQLYHPLKEPIFYKPFGKEILFDIIFDRLKILLIIDFDSLIEFFNIHGVEARWLTKKETILHIEGNKKNRPFVWGNRGIVIKTEESQIVLGDNFIIRLIYDNLYPSSLIEMYKQAKQ